MKEISPSKKEMSIKRRQKGLMNLSCSPLVKSKCKFNIHDPSFLACEKGYVENIAMAVHTLRSYVSYIVVMSTNSHSPAFLTLHPLEHPTLSRILYP